jgi:hypothetical protein
MDQHSRVVIPIVGIAAYVRPPLDDQHANVKCTRESFGQHAPGKPGADN